MHTVVLDGLAEYSDRWYSFWQFVGASATVAAVVVALVFSRRDGKARERAEEELRQERIAREADRRTAADLAVRAQAERVTAWFGLRVTNRLRGLGGEDFIEQGSFMYLANYSPMVVQKIEVTLVAKLSGRTIGPLTEAVLPPSSVPHEVALDRWLDESDGTDIGIQMDFQDIVGRRWRRDRNGLLDQIGDAPGSDLSTIPQ